MSRPRVLVLGCGAVVEGLYAGALRKLEARGIVEVAGLVDPDPSRTALLQRSFRSARAFTIPGDGLARVRPDLTIVASPPGMHAEHVVAALEGGSHVLSEKPMATQVRDAERMVAAASRAGRILAVGMVRRIFPCLADAQELLATGALGDHLRFVYREGTVYGWPARTDAAFRRATAGGGVLTDLGSHVFDFLFALFGAPTELSHADDGQAEGVETNSRTELSFARAQGVAQLSWSQPLATGLHIVGSKAELRLDPGRIDSVLFRPCGGAWETRSGLRPSPVDLGRVPRTESPSTYYGCILHQVVRTLRAMIHNEPVAASGADGLAVVRTIESCYREATSLQLPWLTPVEQSRADERHWNRVRWAAA